jgi:DNA-binding MarR family transcriptional regulator
MIPSQSSAPESVADRLHSAAIHVLRRVREEDRASGLTPARLSALSVVVFAGPLTLGELAAAEQVRPPTMTRIAAALEHAGLVRKSTGADRRSVLITATPKGVRLLQRARERRIAVLADRLSGLPRSELRLLERAAELMEWAVYGGEKASSPRSR